MRRGWKGQDYQHPYGKDSAGGGRWFEIKDSGRGRPRGKGGGAPGDLYIFLGVRPHPIFKRDNDDTICEVPISITQAALGAEIDVPSLEGSVKLRCRRGRSRAKVFRLKGKASPRCIPEGAGTQG